MVAAVVAAGGGNFHEWMESSSGANEPACGAKSPQVGCQEHSKGVDLSPGSFSGQWNLDDDGYRLVGQGSYEMHGLYVELGLHRCPLGTSVVEYDLEEADRRDRLERKVVEADDDPGYLVKKAQLGAHIVF